MSDAYRELLDEARLQVASLQGELAAVRDQLSASVAAEAQLRQEVDTQRLEATIASAELAHCQRELRDQVALAGRHMAELEAGLVQARRIQHVAENERAAVIAALGWRSRRRLARLAEADTRTSESGSEKTASG